MCVGVKNCIVTCEKCIFWCGKGYKLVSQLGKVSFIARQPKNILLWSTLNPSRLFLSAATSFRFVVPFYLNKMRMFVNQSFLVYYGWSLNTLFAVIHKLLQMYESALQNFLTFILVICPHWCKISRPYLVPVPNY